MYAIRSYYDNHSLAKFTGIDLTVTDEKLNDGKIKLKSAGKGNVYYFWSAEGIKLNEKVKEGDSYVRVRREYFSYKTGRKIPDNRFYQGSYNFV